tara:strand:+ start:4133 stop:4318 length:186 start_codon:yes stop_codon:yes gene_type:complete
MFKTLIALILFTSVVKAPTSTGSYPSNLQYKNCRSQLFEAYPKQVNLIQWRKCMAGELNNG